MTRPIGDLDELRGCWRRSLISWPDGRRDETTRVTWLQGIDACLDLRQPAGLGDFPAVSSIDDLSHDDCLRLAQQSGFAGRFIKDGDFFTWQRAIDFQPPRRDPDSGALWWEENVLIERGRTIAYIEHWHCEPNAPVEPIAALTLRSPEDGRAGALLRVGRNFMMARDRAVAVAAEQTLVDLVIAAGDIPAARALVDCEISLGLVGPEAWRISASTLPFCVNRQISMALGDHAVILSSAGQPPRQWDIAAIEGDPGALS